MTDGLRLALTTFTVLPLRTGRVDRRAAAHAMAAAPAVGAGIGGLAAAVALALTALGASGLVAAVVAVTATALVTRGLHLDGVADTVDGLGSYATAGRALEIMKRPDVGAFGVVALVLVLLAQVAAVAAVLPRQPLAVASTLVAALAAGRLAATQACRRGVPAARADGLGALVAGTATWPVVLVGATLVGALAVPAVPGRPWLGPVAVLAGLLAATLLVRHAVHRLGGITGDILGAAVETTTTVTLIVVSVG